ncbi:MAG: hypothetical protein AAGK10_22180, partial [Cyanobacteria bacterium J06555_3]
RSSDRNFYRQLNPDLDFFTRDSVFMSCQQVNSSRSWAAQSSPSRIPFVPRLSSPSQCKRARTEDLLVLCAARRKTI